MKMADVDSLEGCAESVIYIVIDELCYEIVECGKVLQSFIGRCVCSKFLQCACIYLAKWHKT